MGVADAENGRRRRIPDKRKTPDALEHCRRNSAPDGTTQGVSPTPRLAVADAAYKTRFSVFVPFDRFAYPLVSRFVPMLRKVP